VTSDQAIPTAISIAGSDSGGGAGIQADLKAFARCGVHGTTAITALTAQSTVGVDAIHPVPAQMVIDQVRAVAEDIGIDAAKTGMLGDAATIDAVVEALRYLGDAPLVVDPVMVAESGAVLLEPDARSALVERLLPLATVATPNLPEARELTGLGDGASREELARAVQALGPRAAIVTGGHAEDGADVLFDSDGGDSPVRIEGPRHPGGAQTPHPACACSSVPSPGGAILLHKQRTLQTPDLWGPH
jgi:hydroxymethylpyrimidine/phosphomethylpyrimidine kinase